MSLLDDKYMESQSVRGFTCPSHERTLSIVATTDIRSRIIITTIILIIIIVFYLLVLVVAKRPDWCYGYNEAHLLYVRETTLPTTIQ